MIIKNFVHQTELLVKAFEIGIKNVLELDNVMPYEKIIKRLKKKYIYEKITNIKGNSNYYFFKQEKDRDYFCEHIAPFAKENKIPKISTEYGLFMGYPPKACEYFPTKTFGINVVENLLINYNGMNFASFPETIKEDFEWLFKNKSLNSNSFVLIEGHVHKTNEENWEESLLESLDYYITKVLSNKVKRMKEKKKRISS